MQMMFLGLSSLASSLLQAVTGFGFGIVMMAIMPLFLPYEIALNVSTVLSLALFPPHSVETAVFPRFVLHFGRFRRNVADARIPFSHL